MTVTVTVTVTVKPRVINKTHDERLMLKLKVNSNNLGNTDPN